MPSYTHDCESCVFIMEYHAPGADQPVDVYLCNRRTVVIRHGNDLPDYTSATHIPYVREDRKKE